MVFKMIGIERMWRSLEEGITEMMPRPRQLFVTQSRILAEKVEEYTKLLKHQAASETYITRRKPLIRSKDFRNLMNVKYMRSLVEPGEAVGLLASQG